MLNFHVDILKAADFATLNIKRYFFSLFLLISAYLSLLVLRFGLFKKCLSHFQSLRKSDQPNGLHHTNHNLHWTFSGLVMSDDLGLTRGHQKLMRVLRRRCIGHAPSWTTDKHLSVDLTCDVVTGFQIKFRKIVRSFMLEAIKCHLRIKNRASSLPDRHTINDHRYRYLRAR